MKDKNLSIDTKAGWVAVLQHYFVSAWIPNQDVNNQLYSITDSKNNVASIGYRGPVVSIPSGATETILVHYGLVQNYKTKWLKWLTT